MKSTSITRKYDHTNMRTPFNRASYSGDLSFGYRRIAPSLWAPASDVSISDTLIPFRASALTSDGCRG